MSFGALWFLPGPLCTAHPYYSPESFSRWMWTISCLLLLLHVLSLRQQSTRLRKLEVPLLSKFVGTILGQTVSCQGFEPSLLFFLSLYFLGQTVRKRHKKWYEIEKKSLFINSDFICGSVRIKLYSFPLEFNIGFQLNSYLLIPKPFFFFSLTKCY